MIFKSFFSFCKHSLKFTFQQRDFLMRKLKMRYGCLSGYVNSQPANSVDKRWNFVKIIEIWQNTKIYLIHPNAPKYCVFNSSLLLSFWGLQIRSRHDRSCHFNHSSAAAKRIWLIWDYEIKWLFRDTHFDSLID